MKLSILTCHLPERKELLKRLMERLVPQCCDYGEHLNWSALFALLMRDKRMAFANGVEWLIDDADRSVTIGEKRNRLLKRAIATHVAHIDDDDLANPAYVKRILFALQYDPDVVGLCGSLRRPSFPDKLFVHSLAFSEWADEGHRFVRTPNHLNPIRREIALQVGFPDQTHGEDHCFSKQVTPLLKTEVMLEGVLYEYYCR